MPSDGLRTLRAITSFYWWEGVLQEDQEVAMVLPIVEGNLMQ